MIKTRLTPMSNSFNILIPNKFIGKSIEILIYETDEIEESKFSEQPNPKFTIAEFWGVLSDDSASDLKKNEKLLCSGDFSR